MGSGECAPSFVVESERTGSAPGELEREVVTCSSLGLSADIGVPWTARVGRVQSVRWLFATKNLSSHLGYPCLTAGRFERLRSFSHVEEQSCGITVAKACARTP